MVLAAPRVTFVETPATDVRSRGGFGSTGR
jgi:dUTPase